MEKDERYYNPAYHRTENGTWVLIEEERAWHQREASGLVTLVAVSMFVICIIMLCVVLK